jgi:hypothetical protein
MSRQTLVSALGLVLFLSPRAYADDPSCPPSAPDGYFKKTACTVTIDRNNPASPRTIVVRAGTTVTIHLINARANEAITITPTTTGVAPVDVATTFLKSAITPLSSLVVSQKSNVPTHKHVQTLLGTPEDQPKDEIGVAMDALFDKLDNALAMMADASVQLSCLEGYRVIDGKAKNYSCSVKLLAKDTFPAAKAKTIQDMLDAARAPLPAASLQDIKKRIDKHVSDAVGLADDDAKKPGALAKGDIYLSSYNILNSAITDTQKAQTTMLETVEQLSVLANAPDDVKYPIARGKDYNATVAIVGQEVISKTNTTIASVTVNWQSNPWVVSTGIMFSRLANTTFTNAPLFVGGKPQYDAAGKLLTVVQQTDTRPTIMFPLVSASYRIPWLSNFNWENQCPGHCGFLLTGGVGLNLSLKTAEFAVGPSFQFGGLVITPGWHVGRHADLSQGVVPDAQFGSNPPNPLPTTTSWTGKFGIGFSYALPFQ